MILDIFRYFKIKDQLLNKVKIFHKYFHNGQIRWKVVSILGIGVWFSVRTYFYGGMGHWINVSKMSFSNVDQT